MLHLLVSTAPLIVGESEVQVVDLLKWQWLSRGNCPHIWMVNFYCNESQSRGIKRNKALEREFTEAATMLSGVVKAGAYAVGKDFPAFIRIPSVLVYMPNSTHPYVFEMRQHKVQVQRSGYLLVKMIKEKITQRIKFPWPVLSPNILETRIESDEVRLPEVLPAKLLDTLGGKVTNQVSFLLLCNDPGKEIERSALLHETADILHNHYKLTKDMLVHGYTKFENVRKFISSLTDHLVIPCFAMLSKLRPGPAMIYIYEGRLDVQDLLAWSTDRLVDVALMPNDAIQIGVSRDDGFVGQVLGVEGQKLFLTIP